MTDDLLADYTFILALKKDGWYILSLPEFEVLSGPYYSMEEAEKNANGHSHRLNQGWKI